MWDERYRRGEFPDEPAAIVLRALDGVAPGRALDLACGAGRHARLLAERGWEVVAIDASAEALARIDDRRVTTLQLDLERNPLPFPDASFDLVLIINFLHRPLFAEAMRVTRPRGRIVVQTKADGRFALAPGELHEIFEGWELVFEDQASTRAILARRTSDGLM